MHISPNCRSFQPKPFGKKMADFLLIANLVLLGFFLGMFLHSSYVSGQHSRELLVRVDRLVTARSPQTRYDLPEDLPVQLFWRVDQTGLIRSKAEQAGVHLQDLVPSVPGDDMTELARAAMGSVLEPLRNRYLLIGRTLTFHLLIYENEDGTLTALALWRPWSEQLYWFSYACLIWLYIGYWLMAPLWVYVDARWRNLPAVTWASFTLFANVIGLGFYLYLIQKRRLPV